MKTFLLAIATALFLAFAHGQTPPGAPPASDCPVYILADDSFELFINGKPEWKESDYQNIVQKTLSLRRGDVVTVTVTDIQGGLGGSFAVLILRGNATLASSKDFRYTVKPPPDFATSPSLQGLRTPDLEPLPKSFGLGAEKQPKKAWTQKSDRKFGEVHFKYVIP